MPRRIKKGEPLTKFQAELVLAYARNSMSARQTGQELWVSAEDVHYHLRRIKEDSGLDPKNFYDLCRLVGIAVSAKGGTE